MASECLLEVLFGGYLPRLPETDRDEQLARKAMLARERPGFQPRLQPTKNSGWTPGILISSIALRAFAVASQRGPRIRQGNARATHSNTISPQDRGPPSRDAFARSFRRKPVTGGGRVRRASRVSNLRIQAARWR
jgi:hypothetical protein